jgi:hypothetical protein
MLPAIYDHGTHYVTNQKLTLEMHKEISNNEDVVQVSGEYTDCYAHICPLDEARNRAKYSKYSFYG